MERRSPKSKSRTGGQSRFAQIPSVKIPRSAFNRSFGIKTTFSSGWLIPFYCDEALPGDTLSMRANLFCRTATPLHPIMDNLRVETFFFAVPNRLLWDNWERFMGEQDSPGDTIDYEIPQMDSGGGGYPELSVFDYMGIPTKVPNLKHSALWPRAYNAIYNDWFRPQDIVNSAVVDTDDSGGMLSNYPLRRRAKRHDYFTAALPWPQKGPTVPLPLGDQAPLIAHGAITPMQLAGDGTPFTVQTNAPEGFNGPYTSSLGDVGQANSPWEVDSNEDGPGLHWADPAAVVPTQEVTKAFNEHYADLKNATASTINELRQSFQVQRLLERFARGGSRYTEIIRSCFKIESADSRMQRPEWLGGGSSMVSYNPVAATTSFTDGVGELGAYGTAFGTHGFTKSFTEHCTIIGLVNVRADLNYQQGLDRMWSRKTRFDFFWPTLAHLGEQEVYQKEIYATGIEDDQNDNKIFGYQERFAEYRYKPSLITGRMRSNADQTLDTWHLAQDFENAPVLGETFIEENPPVERTIAVLTEPEFLMDAYCEYRCVRPMPAYSVPGLIDHF